MALCRQIYRCTQAMPSGELYGLTGQMRRASVSVPSNIAEGFGREGQKEFLRHLRIAQGSLNELATQHELATSMDMIPSDPTTIRLIEETDLVLRGFIRSVKQSLRKTPSPSA
ncbi:four helix bundle protein [Phycisphaera mikurensis]|nr:four helix bundle protein [Phycisphaera mikurensis]